MIQRKHSLRRCASLKFTRAITNRFSNFILRKPGYCHGCASPAAPQGNMLRIASDFGFIPASRARILARKDERGELFGENAGN